jgi:hypothetical protein
MSEARVGRERLWCAVAITALVLFRSAVPALYEQFNFDSDQAIYGLMAKHMSEFRAFPVFMYGQNYILSVESMVTVPFFWIGGATFVMLRLPLVLMNVAVALWLLLALSRPGGLRPWLALLATLPFVATTPVTSGELIENAGANIEPFVYILALWALRRRPYLFGLVLAVGFLNREFTLFALPAMAIVALWQRELSLRRLLSAAVRAVPVFAVVWLAVNALRETGASEGIVLQIRNTLQRVSFEGGALAAKIRSLFVDCLPDLFGTRTIHPTNYNMITSIDAGSSLAAIALALLGAFVAVRLTFIVAQRRHDKPSETVAFAAYLGLVGLQALAAYPFAENIVPGLPGLLRYVLLALLVPISIVALYFALENRRALIVSATALVLLCAGLNIRDNARMVREYLHAPPASEHRDLANYLVAHGIARGWATYWDAYHVSFLSQERVILASSNYSRIAMYDDIVQHVGRTAVRVIRQPCSEGVAFEEWCIAPGK